MNESVKELLIKRKINWLCHFTPRENINNIKINGLRLRNELGANSVVTDRSRYDRYQNAICLSISKPNKWMFQKKKEQGFDLCLLLISPKVLYQKNCAFYPHNAATASYRNVPLAQLTGVSALENMFENPITYQKSGLEPQSIWRTQWLNLCETTSDQAEVQCFDNIEPEYIQYIIEDDIPLSYDEVKAFITNEENKKERAKIQEIEKEKQEEQRRSIETTNQAKITTITNQPKRRSIGSSISEAFSASADVITALPKGVQRLEKADAELEYWLQERLKEVQRLEGTLSQDGKQINQDSITTITVPKRRTTGSSISEALSASADVSITSPNRAQRLGNVSNQGRERERARIDTSRNKIEEYQTSSSNGDGCLGIILLIIILAVIFVFLG